MKTAYAALAAARADHELARTFFNSATRRVFATVGIDPEIEFVESMRACLEDEGPPPYTSHAHGGATAALIRDILAAHPVGAPYRRPDDDADLIARRIDGYRASAWGEQDIDAIEMLDAVFYRNKGAYLVGRIRGGRRLMPLVIALAVPSASARFQDLSTETRATGTTGNSLIWRFDYWKQALQLGGNPITGIGLGAVSAVTDQAKEPHNDFIRAFVETGVIGLFAYIWMLFAMIGLARKALRTASPGFPRTVAAGFTGALASFMLLSVVSNVITQLVILLYFAAFATCAWAAGRLATPVDPVRGDLVPAEPVPA
jgi:hypothetical protein